MDCPPLPLPGDKGPFGSANTRTVIASVWLRDGYEDGLPELYLGLLMLLNENPPYYTVGQIVVRAGQWVLIEDVTDHFNINYATEDFANSGGDI